METDIDTYSRIKEYKRKRLFNKKAKYFRILYNHTHDPELTQLQYEYKMCKYMWEQRLREEDIQVVMGWWYKRHHLNANWWHLRHVVIPDTYQFTREKVKAQRRRENERAKARRLAAKLNQSGRVQ